MPFLTRELIEDYTFESNKVTIPKGLKIWIPTYAIHNDPDIYPDPDKFDPERFSEDNIKQRHPMHFLPFGHGPRNCIGAYVQQKNFSIKDNNGKRKRMVT